MSQMFMRKNPTLSEICFCDWLNYWKSSPREKRLEVQVQQQGCGLPNTTSQFQISKFVAFQASLLSNYPIKVAPLFLLFHLERSILHFYLASFGLLRFQLAPPAKHLETKCKHFTIMFNISMKQNKNKNSLENTTN